MNLLLLTLISRSALAQDGFDAHGFNLAAFDGDVRSPLVVQRPGRFYAGQFYVGGLLEYAARPLVVATQQGDAITYDPVLDHVFAVNLSAGVAPFSRLRLNVAAPLYFASTGADGAPQGVDIGDLRVDLMGELVRPGEAGGFGLGLVPFIDLPTGNPDHFLGQSGLAGGGKLAATEGLGRLTLGADAGIQLEPSRDVLNLHQGNHLTFGLAGGWAFTEHLGLNLEGHIAVPLKKNEVGGSDTPAEVLLSLRGQTQSGFHWTAGAAAGVVRGASAAEYRFFLGGGWGRPHTLTPVVVDSDQDGILDNVDACPDQPENRNDYKDDDGCPDQRAALTVIVRRDGQPVSGAALTVQGGPAPLTADSNAEAPYHLTDLSPGASYTVSAIRSECVGGEGTMTLAEGDNTLNVDLKRVDGTVRVVVVDQNNQPLPGAVVTWERDGSTCIPVDVFKLGGDGTGVEPVGVGKHTVFVNAPGHNTYSQEVAIEAGKEVLVKVQLAPTKVKVEQQQIMILEMVYFDFNSDKIQDRSFPLLDEVATTLRAHPELTLIEIQGHTDDKGSDTYNLDLSQRRVESVMRYLVGKGVPVGRLVAKGYGESQPEVPNTTDENRAKNRRVEFKIVKQEPAR